MKEILIAVKNKIAMNLGNATYVCDNSDYRVVFDFDAEWEKHPVKTARFKYNGMYQEVVFTGSVCDMPVIRDARLISIGVYAGNLQTSTPAVVHASQSILSGDAVHTEPEEDVYHQLVQLVESGVLKGPDGKSAYELAVENGYIGSEIDWLASLHGAPGKTPEYGVDYGTPEQIADIANQAAGILADDIKEISDGKVDKVDGKGLSTNDYDNAAKKKVDAIPENPKYTDTVTIVDASLTKDGDAADAKVTGEKLNRLKDDLSDKLPKSPANWEAWTAEEQAAARERMNAQGPYKHIATITIDEDGVYNVGIDRDENGMVFSVSDVYIYGYMKKTGVDSLTAVAINTTTTTINGSNNIIKLPSNYKNNGAQFELNIKKSKYWRAYAVSSTGVNDPNISGTTGSTMVSHRGASNVRNNEWETLTALAFATDGAAFGIGTTFDIWGR